MTKEEVIRAMQSKNYVGGMHILVKRGRPDPKKFSEIIWEDPAKDLMFEILTHFSEWWQEMESAAKELADEKNSRTH